MILAGRARHLDPALHQRLGLVHHAGVSQHVEEHRGRAQRDVVRRPEALLGRGERFARDLQRLLVPAQVGQGLGATHARVERKLLRRSERRRRDGCLCIVALELVEQRQRRLQLADRELRARQAQLGLDRVRGARTEHLDAQLVRALEQIDGVGRQRELLVRSAERVQRLRADLGIVGERRVDFLARAVEQVDNLDVAPQTRGIRRLQHLLHEERVDRAQALRLARGLQRLRDADREPDGEREDRDQCP